MALFGCWKLNNIFANQFLQKVWKFCIHAKSIVQDGWMDGLVDEKAALRITDFNQSVSMII